MPAGTARPCSGLPHRVLEQHPGLRVGHAGVGVDPDAAHRAQVDEQAVTSTAREAVATADGW